MIEKLNSKNLNDLLILEYDKDANIIDLFDGKNENKQRV